MKLQKKLETLLIVMLLILAGCSASYKYCQKAAKFESNGMYNEASKYYQKALRYKRNNVTAIAGLKRSSDYIIESYIKLFNNAYQTENYQEAYDRFNELEEYHEKISKYCTPNPLGFNLMTKYNNIKEILAERFYNKGIKELEVMHYDKAITFFKKTRKYKPNYRDVNKQLEKAKNGYNLEYAEKHYQEAMAHFEEKKYIKAYYDFKQCQKYVRDYKESDLLLNKCLEKGKKRIAILDFQNNTDLHGLNKKLQSYILTRIMNCPSPFIEIMDRNNLDRVLNEQDLRNSDYLDQSTAVKAGKIAGVQFVVTGQLLSAVINKEPIREQSVKAYISEMVKRSDGYITFYGKPTYFNMYTGATNLNIQAEIQIISIETGKILSSDIFEASNSDAVKYAKYNGNYTNLTFTPPNSDGFLGPIAAAAGKVPEELFRARSKLKTTEELQNAILENIANRVSNIICDNFDNWER